MHAQKVCPDASTVYTDYVQHVWALRAYVGGWMAPISVLVSTCSHSMRCIVAQFVSSVCVCVRAPGLMRAYAISLFT